MQGSSHLATVLVVALTITSVSADTRSGGLTRTTSECPNTSWPSATLISHESDCTLYYVCFGTQKFLSECPLMDSDGNRLHFDSAAQGCVWPTDSSCTSSTSEATEAPTTTSTECPTDNDGEVIFIAHESNCSLFYKCDHGQKVQKACSDGLVFNPDLKVCDWSENVECETGSVDDSNNSESGVASTENSNDTNDSNSSAEIEDESGSGESNDNNSTDSDLVSSEDSNSAAAEVEDESGTGESNEGTSPPESISVSSEGPSSGATETTTTSSIEKCPADNEGEIILIAHESDCGLFYTCDHGQKVQLACPEGLAFNPALGQCDWPEIVGCTPNSVDDSSSSDSSVTDSSGSIETEWSTTESSTNNSTGDASDSAEIDLIPTECPANNEGDAVHIAHEYDCGLFYVCNHGNKVQMECLAGLHFNPVLQVCDWPTSAGCTLSGPDDSSDSSDTTTPAEFDYDSSEVSDSDSSESADTTTTTTTSAGTDFDSSEVSDSDTTEAEPVIPTECPANNEGEAVHIAHESDCGLFYVCNHGNKVQMECLAGLHFNPVLQVCDWPASAGCTSSSPDDSSDSSATTTSPETDFDSSEVSDSGSGDSNDTTTSAAPDFDSSEVSDSDSSDSGDTTTSAETDFDSSEISDSVTTETAAAVPVECPANNEGGAVHIAHEYDCSLFYLCNHGNKVQMECSAGLHFNPVLQVCDWPASVGCTLTTPDDTSDSSPTTTSAETDFDSSEASDSDSSDSDDTTTSAETDFDSSEVSDSDSSEVSDSDTVETEAEIPVECPTDNEGHAVHIAHESDCGLFYVCNQGNKVQMGCSAGLHFNAVLQVCDWPASAGCTLGNSQDTRQR